jgi:transcriptional regulator with XRE-family HTH domain
MREATMVEPRRLTGEELAGVVKTWRQAQGWSQETLAALSGLSVRTIQRVERGEGSDLDTRRALARAVGSEDIDLFNKPYAIPTSEELKSAQEKFDRKHVTLEVEIATSGRQLADVFASSTMDSSSPAVELEPDAAADFAGLIDYLRDYRDCADAYRETDRLDIYIELQRYIDDLDAAGVSVCYAIRKTRLVGKDWENKTPWPVTLVYVSAFEKGACPKKFAVPKGVSIGRGG